MRGLHWGKVDLDHKDLTFRLVERDANKPSFRIPFSSINATSTHKNEITLEIKETIDNKDYKKHENVLCEVRLFVDMAKL